MTVPIISQQNKQPLIEMFASIHRESTLIVYGGRLDTTMFYGDIGDPEYMDARDLEMLKL